MTCVGDRRHLPLLRIQNLKVYYYTPEGVVKAVDGIDLEIEEEEVIGLVGESGCGKSTIAGSIMKLVPKPGRIIDGRILFRKKDLLHLREHELRKIRGKHIAMIFQDALASLNPVLTVGGQVSEAIKLHQNFERHEVKEKVVEIFTKVGIPDAAKRIKDYPHEFSGGMCQRVMIAMALSCNPNLLIADEPTSSLDVTIQAQIIELMKDLVKEFRSAIFFVTHELGLVGEFCDKVAVMYAGKILEFSDVHRIFRRPKHPYTAALIHSVPGLNEKVKEFMSIRGSVPSLINPPKGCRFHPRCVYATEVCRKQEPRLIEIEPGHKTACFHEGEIP